MSPAYTYPLCPGCGIEMDLEMEIDAGACVDCLEKESRLTRPVEIAFTPRTLTPAECEDALMRAS